MIPGPNLADPPLFGVDADMMRFFELHEARCSAVGGRRIVRDLGDAILVQDPHDRDPFPNRLSGIRFPSDPAAFDRRMAEVYALFAAIDRRPHIWASAAFNTPDDLDERLQSHGFVDVGAGMFMVHVDSDRLAAVPPAEPDTTIEVFSRPPDPIGQLAAAEASLVLAESFGLEPAARAPLIADMLGAFRSEDFFLYLVRLDGEPVAVAKRTTFDGASYLSSIGTRPGWQGRGLAALVTAATVRDGIAVGCQWTYLGVFGENARARRMYERVGFEALGGTAADWLLP